MTPKRTCWLVLTILVALTTSGCMDAMILATEIKISEYAKKDTQELISIVQDKNQSGISHRLALGALGGRFKDRTLAMPVLVETLKSADDGLTRQHAVISLRRLADPAAVPALVELLSDGNSDVRAGAAQALGAIGLRARKAVPVLEGLAIEDEAWLVRGEASVALKRIAPEP